MCDLLVIDGGAEFPDSLYTVALRVGVETSDCFRANCCVFKLVAYKPGMCVCVCVCVCVRTHVMLAKKNIGNFPNLYTPDQWQSHSFKSGHSHLHSRPHPTSEGSNLLRHRGTTT